MSKQILVTGASSGIGLCLVHHLSSIGHTVYAGVRKQQDFNLLVGFKNIIPVILDVTNNADIAEFKAIIKASNRPLYGLVNNAGLGGLGHFNAWQEDELKVMFDVNVFGPWRLTKACIDSLLVAQGRVVNIGAQSGVTGTELLGPYTMTKNALDAFTESLRNEVAEFGVKVSLIQPGNIKSKMEESTNSASLERLERASFPFNTRARILINNILEQQERPEFVAYADASEPEFVSHAVEHALFSDEPKERYVIGTHNEGTRLIETLLKRVVQTNKNPDLHYTRDELIEILDRYLA
ncbi:SDR family NAD(P)-dependent oxidoreductase [Pseudoalteromonas luteoviolacea]|uniref:Short-chain dehydrogenase n=1 Tax=Pseudoalteromonas luteoviolacea S4060-1 TaxID=1365257 RepID=A0A167K6R9_9GAMM|nr:SDR family NAD(P)-dependent oxidoreductase [Pseudoalteromonas luteoviolacea]KZN62211.1 hypothetical protein N478_25715 [Pseudoalteromonas luteoviolacea S4060-1]